MADKTLLDLDLYSTALTGDELMHIVTGATGLEVDYRMKVLNLLTYLMSADGSNLAIGSDADGGIYERSNVWTGGASTR